MTKLFLSILFILFLFTISTCFFFPQSFDLESDLVFHYKFTGNLFDSSNNNYHAIAVGGTFVNDRNGNPAQAYRLRRDEYIEIPYAINCMQPSWTYSIVFKLNEYTTNGASGLLAMENSGDDHRPFPLYIRSMDNKHFLTTFNNDVRASSEYKIDIDKWYHVCLVIKDNDAIFYVNGNEVKRIHQFDPYNYESSYNYYISHRFLWDFPIYFLGTIDDVRFYDRALKPIEIKFFEID